MSFCPSPGSERCPSFVLAPDQNFVLALLSERCDVHYSDEGKEELVKLEHQHVWGNRLPVELVIESFPSCVLAPDPSVVRALS